jgi:hypothetical protein
MKKYRIDIPLYNGTLYVIDTTNVEQAVKNTHGNDYDIDDTESCLISKHSGDFYLYIDLVECSIGILAHELFHATHRILEYFGVEFTSKNHEPFAYLLEYLMNECIKLRKQFKEK